MSGKSVFEHSDVTDEIAAKKESLRLEEKFDTETIKAYIDNDGWEPN